jgi:hypothetical protein
LRAGVLTAWKSTLAIRAARRVGNVTGHMARAVMAADTQLAEGQHRTKLRGTSMLGKNMSLVPEHTRVYTHINIYIYIHHNHHNQHNHHTHTHTHTHQPPP